MMRSQGKVAKQWLKTRKEWIKLNPPDHQGYYICHICANYVHYSEMELDHIQSRSRRPDLRFDLDNLSPSHHTCNARKGSK